LRSRSVGCRLQPPFQRSDGAGDGVVDRESGRHRDAECLVQAFNLQAGPRRHGLLHERTGGKDHSLNFSAAPVNIVGKPLETGPIVRRREGRQDGARDLSDRFLGQIQQQSLG
jgi:hypothetical protein